MEKIKVDMKIKNEQSILDKMYDDFLHCPEAVRETKRLGIPDEKIKKYIVKINDFVQDINYCKRCPGVKKCKKHNPLLVTNITYSRGVVERKLAPCPRILEQMDYENQFYFHDFSSDKMEANLRTLDKKTEPRQKVLLKIKNYFLGNEMSWIFICGVPNTGRSYLAAAIANEFARKKKGPISFINASLRFKELSDYSFSDRQEFENTIHTLANCPLLIIDDFGNEFKNDFIRDGIVFQILSRRSNRRLLTIFTSDFTIDEIVTLYSTSKPGAIRAKQIGNLLKENCKEEINLGEISVY
ncbi:MAG: ATP-binding protein [Bacilli bacterium]